MKRLALILLALIVIPLSLICQNEMWPVNAMDKGGKSYPVKVFLGDDISVPVYAIYEDGNNHFMDVKGIHNGKEISIKLIASNDILVPVKGISEDGDIFNVKAVTPDNEILDVKGVSRDGNTLNIAALDAEGKNMPLKAVSKEGVEREVKGVKVMEEFFEMEFGDIKVIGHVKALPIVEVGKIDSEWEVMAYTEQGEKLKLIATSEKGVEYPVQAEMPGKLPYFMNVRAVAKILIYVKLVKNGNKLVLTGIDEFGRVYNIRAITESGESYSVLGGKTTGNVTPIYVAGPEGNHYPVKAISSKGHEFEVKGIKVKEDDVEGIITGLNKWVRYYAHVKALAPEKEVN